MESLESIEGLQVELAMTAKIYKKFFKKAGFSKKKDESSSSQSKRLKEFNPECCNCHEMEHIAPNCPNKKSKGKNKAMNAPWSESEDSDSDSDSSHEGN